MLRGDATQDGRVNAADLGLIKQKLNRVASQAGNVYSAFADLNGDGQVNALDLAAAKQRLNTVLPTLEPAALLSRDEV